MSEVETKRPVGDWEAALLRVTAFLKEGYAVSERSYWKELPIESLYSAETKPGSLTEQGEALGHWLVLTSTEERVDWVFIPRPDSLDFGFSSVGSFCESASKFINLIGDWLKENQPEIDRLAFGSTAHLAVEDRVDGYETVSRYLPFNVDGKVCSDLSYQINRPRHSGLIQDLKINRLSRWSVSFLTGFRAKLTGGTPSTLHPTKSRYRCQVVFDINSDPEQSAMLDKSRLSELLAEFKSLAEEILEKGDIA